MGSSRWLIAIAAMLVANAALVLVTSVWRLATADDAPNQTRRNATLSNLTIPGTVGTGTVVTTQDASSSERDDNTDAPDEAKTGEPVAKSLPTLEDASPVHEPSLTDSLPPPELDELPSRDEESMERDPVFQEFREMFEASQNEDSLIAPMLQKDISDLPPRLDNLPGQSRLGSNHRPTRERSMEYYTTVDARLETIDHLLEAARGLNAEAASASKHNKRESAGRLAGMTEELRRMAAQLLEEDL